MKNVESVCSRRKTTINSNFKGKALAAVPDGGWGWLVCLSCLFGNFAASGPVLCYGIILPSLKEYYKEGVFIISVVGSVLSSLGFAVGPLAAILSNNLGLRSVYILGALLFGISLISATFLHGPYMLLLTYGILAGIGNGLLILPVTIGCNYYFEKRRALANGIAKTGVSLSVFIYPPMTEYILSQFDWKAAAWVYGAVLVISCFFGALIRPLELTQIKKDNSLSGNESLEICSILSLQKGVTTSPNHLGFVKDLEAKEQKCKDGDDSRRPSIMQIKNFMENNKDIDSELVFEPKKRRGSKIYLPPLAMNDAYYDSSVSNIKTDASANANDSNSYQVHPISKQRRGSVISLKSIHQELGHVEDDESTFMHRCDNSLWGNTYLWIFALHRLLADFGQCIFFMFVPILVIDSGFTLNQASLLIMVYGITNTFARFASGILMDHPAVNNLILTASGCFIQAILMCIFPFCSDYIILLALSAIMGILVAPYQIGLSIIAGEMFPIEKVASVCGLMSFAQGIGNIIGPPLVGFIYDQYNNHLLIFCIIAIGYFMSGISCWISGRSYDKRKNDP